MALRETARLRLARCCPVVRHASNTRTPLLFVRTAADSPAVLQVCPNFPKSPNKQGLGQRCTSARKYTQISVPLIALFSSRTALVLVPQWQCHTHTGETASLSESSEHAAPRACKPRCRHARSGCWALIEQFSIKNFRCIYQPRSLAQGSSFDLTHHPPWIRLLLLELLCPTARATPTSPPLPTYSCGVQSIL